jgi:hypothetical protein
MEPEKISILKNKKAEPVYQRFNIDVWQDENSILPYNVWRYGNILGMDKMI